MDANVVKSGSIIEDNLQRFRQALGGFRRRRLLQLLSAMLLLILPIVVLTMLSFSDGLPWYLMLIDVCVITVALYYLITLLYGSQSYYRYGCCFKPFHIVSEPHVEAIKQSGLIESVLNGEVTGNEVEIAFTRGFSVQTAVANGKRVETSIEMIALNCKWYLTHRGITQSSLQIILSILAMIYGLAIGILISHYQQWDMVPLILTMVIFVFLTKHLMKDTELYTVAFYRALDERLAETATLLHPASHTS